MLLLAWRSVKPMEESMDTAPGSTAGEAAGAAPGAGSGSLKSARGRDGLLVRGICRNYHDYNFGLWLRTNKNIATRPWQQDS